MVTTEYVHVTRISAAGGVYGHTDDHCDDAGCAAADLYYSQIDASEVEIHETYAIDADGKVLSRLV